MTDPPCLIRLACRALPLKPDELVALLSEWIDSSQAWQHLAVWISRGLVHIADDGLVHIKEVRAA